MPFLEPPQKHPLGAPMPPPNARLMCSSQQGVKNFTMTPAAPAFSMQKTLKWTSAKRELRVIPPVTNAVIATYMNKPKSGTRHTNLVPLLLFLPAFLVPLRWGTGTPSSITRSRSCSSCSTFSVSCSTSKTPVNPYI